MTNYLPELLYQHTHLSTRWESEPVSFKFSSIEHFNSCKYNSLKFLFCSLCLHFFKWDKVEYFFVLGIIDLLRDLPPTVIFLLGVSFSCCLVKALYILRSYILSCVIQPLLSHQKYIFLFVFYYKNLLIRKECWIFNLLRWLWLFPSLICY